MSGDICPKNVWNRWWHASLDIWFFIAHIERFSVSGVRGFTFHCIGAIICKPRDWESPVCGIFFFPIHPSWTKLMQHWKYRGNVQSIGAILIFYEIASGGVGVVKLQIQNEWPYPPLQVLVTYVCTTAIWTCVSEQMYIRQWHICVVISKGSLNCLHLHNSLTYQPLTAF